MATVAPDTRVRATAEEAAVLSFEGDPASLEVTFASTGETVDVSEIAAKSAPDLLDVTWELAGVKVSASIEIVATRYCTLGSIIGYRADQYELEKDYAEDDEAVWEARARAEEVIESEAHRAFQPVMRRGYVDRPNCRTRTLVYGPDGYDPDLRSIVSAVDQNGDKANVRQARPGSPYVDVSMMPFGGSADLVYVSGTQMPSEAPDAVRALAAWYLSAKTSPDNATSTSTEAGIINFVIGGVDGAATSLPEVNALIERHGRKDYQVG